MSQQQINLIDYLTGCIGAFALRFALSNSQAYNYLEEFQGLRFLTDFYDVEHTQSIDDAIDDCIEICKRNGGKLQ